MTLSYEKRHLETEVIISYGRRTRDTLTCAPEVEEIEEEDKVEEMEEEAEVEVVREEEQEERKEEERGPYMHVRGRTLEVKAALA